MLVGGVIDDEVDDYADAALPATMGEFDEVAQGTVARIDAVVVRDIVSVVLGGRRLERHQPNRGDAKPVQIVQTAQQAFEIADAVAIGIHVGADGQAIYHAVLIPEVINHRAGPRWSALRSQWRPWYKRRGAFRVPRASQFVPPVTAAQNRFAIEAGSLADPRQFRRIR